MVYTFAYPYEYQFKPRSHFGMEDMQHAKLWKGVLLGLVVAALILVLLACLVLKQNQLQRYASVKSDGTLTLDMSKFGLELVLPISVLCAVAGGVYGHMCLE